MKLILAPAREAVSAQSGIVNPQLKVAAQVGIAPTPFRLTGGRTTLIPLSKRLLICDLRLTHFGPLRPLIESRVNGQSEIVNQESGHRGRTCTCDRLVPGQACCSYTTRCCPEVRGGPRGLGSLDDRTTALDSGPVDEIVVCNCQLRILLIAD